MNGVNIFNGNIDNADTCTSSIFVSMKDIKTLKRGKLRRDKKGYVGSMDTV